MMARDSSNIVSLQAARKKAAEEEVRRMKQHAAAQGRGGPLSKFQLWLIAGAVVLAYLAISYFSGGGFTLS